MLARYFFAGEVARIDELQSVPSHRIEEARVILMARFKARMEGVKEGASGLAGGNTVLIPDF